MNFIIIPDSFKGTLSSGDVCNIIEKQILSRFPESIVSKVPVADGGEGSVDAFLQAASGIKIPVMVAGPYFEKIPSFYGLIDQGRTAVIEMAACAGLPLVDDRKNPSKTTTYGVGEIIKHALDRNVNKIILGLGGSATNDGGTGCAAALGVKFIDSNGNNFIPVGATLSQIADIDLSSFDPRMRHIESITMCDIDNPLYGRNGAAYVFGPQKGADAQMVKDLDSNLQALANIVTEKLDIKDSTFKGAGAAGGMGYGMKVFFNSVLQMGIETVLDAVRFDELASKADYIITGEGKLDEQSLRGKVVIGVARRAKKHPAKTIAIVGTMSGSLEDYIHEGLNQVFITNVFNRDFETVKKTAKLDLEIAVNTFLDTIEPLI